MTVKNLETPNRKIKTIIIMIVMIVERYDLKSKSYLQTPYGHRCIRLTLSIIIALIVLIMERKTDDDKYYIIIGIIFFVERQTIDFKRHLNNDENLKMHNSN